MTFLPIVGRELRVASRRRSTYWVRALAALGAIVLGGLVYFSSRYDAPQEFGQRLFGLLAGLSIFYCLTSGVRTTADCLSEEKREGTLGLLFLTDLKGYDVVFGKLVATSLSAFYGLLAIFPVLAVPLLMGGITNGEFWRMVLVLTNTFLFSLAIGIFISSLNKFPRWAMGWTFFLLLLVTVIIPICVECIPALTRSPGLAQILYLPDPFTAFNLSSDAMYPREVHHFWLSVGIIHGLTWFCLIAAGLIVPRSWQDRPAGARAVRWRGLWHKWSYGDLTKRNAYRKRLLDANAFYWLAARARLKPMHVWVFLGLIACLWTWGAVEVGREWFTEVIYLLTAIVLNTIIKLWVASEAGRRLGEDRKLGALELLLSTPLSVSEILRGQLLALRRQFLGPILLIMVVELTFLVSAMRMDSLQGDRQSFLISWLIYMLMFVADVIALSWVGMWVALTTRNPNRATGITVARVLILPWAILIGVSVLISVFAAFAFSSSQLGWAFFLGLWFGAGVLADLLFGLSARRQLQANLRQIAMERYTPTASRLSRFFSRRREPLPNPPPVIAV